jgi:cytochrome P450
MLDEARVMLAAGTETTAQTLSAITYHMLQNPNMLKTLKAELEVAMPDPSVLPNAIPTEQLPYLVRFLALRKRPTYIC